MIFFFPGSSFFFFVVFFRIYCGKACKMVGCGCFAVESGYKCVVPDLDCEQ